MPFTVRNGLEKYAPLLFRPGRELTVAERDRVSSVLKRHPALLPYYNLKERLIQISLANTIAEARALLTEWRREIPSSLLSDFTPILLSMSAWESELFAYLALGPRVDYVPSLRSFVCETNKEGAGYSLKHLRARLLYSEKALARAKALRLQSSSLRPSLSIDLTA
jgi:transposase